MNEANTKETHNKNPVVFTSKAECRDCCRCLRQCPVKAIRMDNGQASVVPERCISCGTCIRECPQGAKKFRNDLDQVILLLKENPVVAVTIAPSYAVFYEDYECERMPSLLRKLGFAYAAETSVGAWAVAQESKRLHKKDKPSICTACPAAVGLVEKYVPVLVPYLLPIASPMVAHAAIIREKLGADTKVVFIGPCIAKKQEADETEGKQKVDYALTFKEFEEWLERENIKFDCLEPSQFDDQPAGDARLLPLPGGITQAAGLGSGSLIKNILSISGQSEYQEFLDTMKDRNTVKDSRLDIFLDLLFCSQGCINGPGATNKKNLFRSRERMIEFAAANSGTKETPNIDSALISRLYSSKHIGKEKEVTEEKIGEILEATGRKDPADQLNCGACGYDTCRDKAIAVIHGMAESDMCIPYMRRLAERRTDMIFETSPSGLIILDYKLAILSINPSFKRMFLCSEAVLGKHISYLIDPEAFERVLTEKEDMVEETVKHSRYNLITHQTIYRLANENQLVGIFMNVTSTKKNSEDLATLRSQTMKQAREMLEHQINVSQRLAMFLGESTAQGESIIENLIKLAGEDIEEDNRRKEFKWDTSMSK